MIPHYEQLMLPVLEEVRDGKEHAVDDVKERLTERFHLTADELAQLLPSGRQPVWTNRFGWAKTYLVKAGLVETLRRGYFRITTRGSSVLGQKPKDINVQYLLQFPEFAQFKMGVKPPSESQTATEERDDRTPEEQLEANHATVKSTVEAELLAKVKSGSPQFFEQLVVDLLIALGYGGNRKDAGEAIGKSGDGGIDGIIREDRLGLEAIYVQAKKWENSVGRPEIQKFVGALHGRKARRGVFITTSEFTRDAIEYADVIETKVVLIDGRRLAKLMFENDVGVSTIGTYAVKRVDTDYFNDE